VSFTKYCKGHTIHAGPERASGKTRVLGRNILPRTLVSTLKEIFQNPIEYYLQKLNHRTNVHNITHPNEIPRYYF
jgi:hypothetical protein